MKVYVRKWMGKGFGKEEVVELTAYEGLSFRASVEPTSLVTTNYPGWRVTEMYVRANEEALCVYLEEVENECN